MMKKITLLIVGVLLSSAHLLGQSIEVHDWIESQYINPSHKAFIYTVSPQAKAADLYVLEKEIELRKKFEKLHAKFKGKQTINNDTTWSYTEYRAPDDSVFKLTNYSYRWTEGETYEDSKTYYNLYQKRADSTTWLPQSKQTNIRSTTSLEDSTISLYFQNDTLPYYGSVYRLVKEPTNNSDYEYYQDQYSKDIGWFKYEHGYSYRNEDGQDTLSIIEKYNQEKMMYMIQSENRYLITENYVLRSRKYFSGDSANSISNWDYDYTRREDDRTIYQVTKRWNYAKKILEGTDSLYFDYKTDFVEGRGFVWQDTVWAPNSFYRSYQRTIPNPDPSNTYQPVITLVDSVIVYSIYPDSVDQDGNIVIDDVMSKSEFEYNADGNQTEVRSYTMDNGNLILASKTIRVYKTITESSTGKENSVLVLQESYGLNYTTKLLYKSGTVRYEYGDDGIFKGNLSVNLSSSGDTTYAYGSSNLKLSDGTIVYVTSGWDYLLKKLIVQGYRAYPRSTQNNNAYLNQSTYYDNRTNSGDRSINVTGKIPAIMNDGPINAAVGDTLLFYLSARNIDFSIPEVSVTDMPASATFDPETRRFFWVVDEEKPSPMTYTATNSQASSTVIVEFVSIDENDLTGPVSNEEDDSAKKFSLAQNYPNPFNPSTTIKFNLPQASEVSLKVYNMLGQEVATLVNERMGQGLQAVIFDASSLASGMYIYRLQAGSFQQTKKMMLIK